MTDASTDRPSLAILGAGSMGGAILHGLVDAGMTAGGVTVTNRSPEKADALADLPGVTSIALDREPDANARAAAAADVVMVGVKPAMVPDLLGEIGAHLRPGTVVVSLAAGVTIATFERILGPGIPVVRSMPNTPAIVGRAVTGVSAGSEAEPEHIALVRALFGTVGDVVVVPEEQIDALSTISGSGPAYVFLLVESMVAAARHQGFDDDTAHSLVQQTFAGAIALLEASGEDPAELRRKVTSPRGTTEQAIAVMADADLPAIFSRATDAALARAKELAAASG